MRHPTYGYFSASRFACRRPEEEYREVSGLVHRGAPKYPTAEFDIIAHSNGTYILGQSLKKTPGMGFENVALAGSVLPTCFPWKDLVDNKLVDNKQVGRKQVGRVRIIERTATDPWLYCANCFERATDCAMLGTAGFAGFEGGGNVRGRLLSGGSRQGVGDRLPGPPRGLRVRR